MVRVPHRKLVCSVHRLRPLRAAAQRSPPPTTTPECSRWEQLPPANRRRLLHLLSRLVERQVAQQAPLLVAGGEEATHDLHQ
jgi:hypothetical protein